MGTAIFKKFPLTYGFEGQRVLNMGCGTAKFAAKNVTNVDAFDECRPDITWDMESTKKWSWAKDEEYGIVIFNHVLEHVKNWWHCFEEGARVLKPGGLLILYVPGPGSDSQLGYRDHVNVINKFSFYGVDTTSPGTNAWAEHNKESPANRLQMIAIDRVYYNKPWLRHAPAWWRRWCGEHLRNVIDEEGFFFRKLGQRVQGR